MSYEDRKKTHRQQVQTGQATQASERSVAPGKRTLTMRLPPGRAAALPPVQQKPDPAAEAARREQAALTRQWVNTTIRPDLHPPPVQMRGRRALPEADVHRVAAEGLSGAASTLPHLDRIQASFGAHDVSGVQAHTGGAATRATRALGARAYAMGSSVALGPDADLHTVAHEAAHVVQQRAGVALAGGVGAAGDRYERHADAVADAVVAGRSAEPLLNGFGPPAAGASRGVQRAAVQLDEPAATSSEPAVDDDAAAAAGMELAQGEIARLRQDFEQNVRVAYEQATAQLPNELAAAMSAVRQRLDAWTASVDQETLAQFAPSYQEAIIRQVGEDVISELADLNPLIGIPVNVAKSSIDTHLAQQQVEAAQQHNAFLNQASSQARDALTRAGIQAGSRGFLAVGGAFARIQEMFDEDGSASVVERGLGAAAESSDRRIQAHQESEAVAQVEHYERLKTAFQQAVNGLTQGIQAIPQDGQQAVRRAQVAYTHHVSGGSSGRSPQILLRGNMLRPQGDPRPPGLDNVRVARVGEDGIDRDSPEHVRATLGLRWQEAVQAGFAPRLVVAALSPAGSCEMTITGLTSDSVTLAERTSEIDRVLAGMLTSSRSTEHTATLVLRMLRGRLASTPLNQL